MKAHRNVLESRFCIRLQVEPTVFGPTDRTRPKIGAISIHCVEINRFAPVDEESTQSPKGSCVLN
jgi:hypothetical protein